MNWQNISFDWNQARAFLATAEAGSFSAAARALGLTQPTLSRQVAALESGLGVLLFQRVGRTLRLTEPGLDLLDHFRAMGDAALQISLAASGRSQAVSGRVSITATDVMSAFRLPEAIKRIAEEAPGIEIDLVVSNQIQDLRRREADIAIRHVRPQEGDLVARLLGETTAHLYAAASLLDRLGRPSTVDDLREFPFVGFAPVDRVRSVLNGMGLPIDRSQFKVVTDNGIAMCELVKHGLGVGVMTRETSRMLPGVECVLPDFQPFPVPVWLTTHRELHTSKRIRLVFDILAQVLR
ncbi:LysR family transcriptional regulator [Nitratireductor thuwali]|uniref:HTH-type transcriptional regulator TdfR n=1 Tax=Nitratireductor thuwali TaxID=2267699 RepID=A0ABY5MHF6_9HYPH|nr:HTH-type transcriptional regulator TdfR [Nitratireductor thuwali]